MDRETADRIRLLLAKTCKERIEKTLPAEYMTGKVTPALRKKRDVAALDFFAGAMSALEALNEGDGNAVSGLTFLIAVRGYSEVLEYIERGQPEPPRRVFLESYTPDLMIGGIARGGAVWATEEEAHANKGRRAYLFEAESTDEPGAWKVIRKVASSVRLPL